MRSSTGDELERLARPRVLSLEEALEFCHADECVEVAPSVVRIRKVVLGGTTRARERARAKIRDAT
jgi:GTP-binding protein